MITRAALRSRAGLLLLGIGVLLLYGHRLGATGLLELDEARYAAVAREMAESGDWLVPRLNGIAHFTKPPLAYWSAAAAFRLLGPTELAARLGPLLAALATLAATWGIGRRLGGRAAAAWGVAVLATSPEFFMMGRTLSTDIFLTAACTVALLGAVWDWTSPDAGVDRGAGGCKTADRAGPIGAGLFWSALGIGFLAKGPVVFIIVGGALSGSLAFAEDRRRLRGLLRWWGPLVFAAIALPWYTLAAARTPGLLAYWLGQEVVGRVAADVHHRGGPWYYFLPVLALGCLPWSVLLPAAATEPQPRAAAARRLLLAWLLVPLAMLSLSRSKLPTYILPLFPAAALLVGGYLARLPELGADRRARRTAYAFGALAFAIAAGLAIVAWHPPMASVRALMADEPLLEELAELLGPLAVGAALGAAALLAGRFRLARAAWLAGAAAMLVQGVYELDDVAAVDSLKGLAAVAGGPADRVATYHLSRYGLRFYTDRPVLEVGGGRDLRFEADPAASARRFAPSDDGALVAASREAAAAGGRLFVLARARDAARVEVLVPGGLEPVGVAGDLALLATAPPPPTQRPAP